MTMTWFIPSTKELSPNILRFFFPYNLMHFMTNDFDFYHFFFNYVCQLNGGLLLSLVTGDVRK